MVSVSDVFLTVYHVHPNRIISDVLTDLGVLKADSKVILNNAATILD